MRLRQLHLATALLAVTACARSGDASSSFSGGPGSDAGTPASEGSESSTSSSSSSTGGSGDVSTGAAPGSTGTFDVGVQPDFVPPPAGCKGKIDFLFLVSRHGLMETRQAQLTAAFPKFIETIESKFADFDYHIMVVDGDGPWPKGWWGDLACNDVCPNLDCKVGQSCCKYSGEYDEPCCRDPNYPCEAVDTITPCDSVWGAGVVFNAGPETEDRPCPIDGDYRYITKGQTDLEDTFACIATVGVSGYDFLGQALTAAMQKPINDYGGCNELFLRDDALLMVTLISSTWDTPYDSEGSPADWAQAVLDAKHGDERSVVLFNVGDPDCEDHNRLCHLTEMFTYHHQVAGAGSDYGPGFIEAANLVNVACETFVPPPG